MKRFSRKIFDKFSNTKFNQNPSSGAEVFYVERRTDMTKLIVPLRNFATRPKKLTSQTILLPKKKECALIYTISALLKVIAISQDFANFSPCSPLHIHFIWDIFKFYLSINTQTIKLTSALQAIRYNSVHIHASLLFTIRSAFKIYLASSSDNPITLRILNSPCRSQISSLFTLHHPRITALLVFNSSTSVLLFTWHIKFYISTKLHVKSHFQSLRFWSEE